MDSFVFFYSSHWLGTICEMVRIVHSSHGKSKCQSIRSDYQTTRVLSRASWSSIKWMGCTDIILLDISPPTSEYLSIILFLFYFSSFLQTWKLLFLLFGLYKNLYYTLSLLLFCWHVSENLDSSSILENSLSAKEKIISELNIELHNLETTLSNERELHINEIKKLNALLNEKVLSYLPHCMSVCFNSSPPTNSFL